MSDLNLTAFGDKELWYVTGSIPEGPWSLPLWVHRYSCSTDPEEYVRLHPIAILPFQAEHIARLFDPICLWSKGGSYLIRATSLERLAHKAPGVTPDFYRQWPGWESSVPKRQQIAVKNDEPDPTDRSFLQYLSTKRGISYALIKLVYWAIRDEGADWMIGQKKPIDLGFVTLYPTPFRANWKDSMLTQHPSAPLLFKNQNLHERNRELVETGFIADLCSARNIAIDPTSHTIRWSIEAIPNQEWAEANDRIESLRLTRSGKTHYVAEYEKTLHYLLSSLLHAFTAFLGQIALPIAILRHGRLHGRRSLVPYLKRPRSTKPVRKLPCRVVISDQLLSLDDPDYYIHPPPAPLPALPPVLPPTIDLREPAQQPVLDQSTNPTT